MLSVVQTRFFFVGIQRSYELTNYSLYYSRELRIASLKSRRLATIPSSALEALRNKQNELQSDKREFKIFCDLRVDEINRRTTELLEKEVILLFYWKRSRFK